MNLKGKKIILGICGSIAAYKAATLIRFLVKQEAEVKVIMTRAATQFITPLTLFTLSKNEVLTELNTDSTWTNHVELGLWADVLLIAPASANTISKMATGACDNLLLATYLSARCPVIVAPAMDVDMWHHPATQENISKLKTHKVEIIDVENGELASGLYGDGRMAEPENIISFLENHFKKINESVAIAPTSWMNTQSFLINAGATREAIDPVRFISNHSSGKMGIALAEELAKLGIKVTLVLGVSTLQPKFFPNLKIIKAESADEMYNVMMKEFNHHGVCICAAAVADYTPAITSKSKIKKKTDTFDLHLTKTKDILAALGKRKMDTQYLVGFALETDNEIENAKAKLKNKNLDLIVLNTMKDKGAGFNHDTNKVTLINKENKITKFALKEKTEVAKDILNYISKYGL